MTKSRGNPKCIKNGHVRVFVGTDGFVRCADCRTEYYRKYVKEHPAYNDKRHSDAKKLMKSPEYRAKEVPKRRARQMAAYHKLTKPICEAEDCNVAEDLHMHHPDYSKPLEVVTLCRHHHERIHHG